MEFDGKPWIGVAEDVTLVKEADDVEELSELRNDVVDEELVDVEDTTVVGLEKIVKDSEERIVISEVVTVEVVWLGEAVVVAAGVGETVST